MLCLDEKFSIAPIHKLGLFFNPRFKSLRAFSAEEKNEVLNPAKQLLQLICLNNASGPGNSMSDHTYQAASTNGSYNRLPVRVSLDDEFEEWQSRDDTAESDKDEVELYQEFCFEDSFTNDFFSINGVFQIIKFWYSSFVTEKFPKLSKLACGVLSVPASSCASERTFSSCGNTVSTKRAQLSGSTVDSIIVLNSSWKSQYVYGTDNKIVQFSCNVSLQVVR